MTTTPTLTYLGGKWWQVAEPISVDLSDGNTITIPKGMVTDLASVPRFLWGIFPPANDALIAYLVHDYLYIYDYRQVELGDKVARRFADTEMYRLATLHNPHGFIDNYIRFFFVRLFGWYLFKNRRYNLKAKRDEA